MQIARMSPPHDIQKPECSQSIQNPSPGRVFQESLKDVTPWQCLTGGSETGLHYLLVYTITVWTFVHHEPPPAGLHTSSWGGGGGGELKPRWGLLGHAQVSMQIAAVTICNQYVLCNSGNCLQCFATITTFP